MKKIFFILNVLLITSIADAQTGIGTTTPVNKFEIVATKADPAISGSAANGNLRLGAAGANTHILDFGLSSTSTYSWIQSRDKTYGTNYSLIINPLGGSVGIGNVSPSGTLEIGSSSGSVPGYLVLNPTTTGSGLEGAEINIKPAPFTTTPSAAQTWVIDQVSNNNNPRLRFFPSISGEDNGLTIKDGGFVGIGVPNPTVKLQVNGDIIANSIAGSSDIRYKKNIRPVENALDKVKSLRGVYFNWNQEAFPNKEFSDKTELGFIAQEVEKIVPEIVFKDKSKEEYRSVKYDKLVALLVEAIKEQQKQIDSLTIKVNKLSQKRNR